MSNNDTPSDRMLDIFERLEAEDQPTRPQDPELAELVASDPEVAAYASDLESVHQRLAADAAPALPPAHRFERLSDAVMGEVTRDAPVRQRGGAAPGFMDRVRTFFSSFGLPQMALVAAVLMIGVVAWVLVASDTAQEVNDSPGTDTPGDEHIAEDDNPDALPESPLDDGVSPDDAAIAAIADLEFDDDIDEDEVFDGLALLASADDGDNELPDEGLYDEFETLSYAELEALDAELADL